jgi:hypothetical protein
MRRLYTAILFCSRKLKHTVNKVSSLRDLSAVNEFAKSETVCGWKINGASKKNNRCMKNKNERTKKLCPFAVYKL